MRQRLAQKLLMVTLAFVSTETAFAAAAAGRPPIARRRSGSTTPLTSPRSGSVTPSGWGHFHDPSDSDGSSWPSAGTAIPEDSDSDTGSCSGHAERCFMARENALNAAYKTGDVAVFVAVLDAIKRDDGGLSVGTFLRLVETILQKSSHDKITCDDTSLFNMFDALIGMYVFIIGFDDLSQDEIDSNIAHFASRLNNMAPPKSDRLKVALTRFWPACAEHISATRERGIIPGRLKKSMRTATGLALQLT